MNRWTSGKEAVFFALLLMIFPFLFRAEPMFAPFKLSVHLGYESASLSVSTWPAT